MAEAFDRWFRINILRRIDKLDNDDFVIELNEKDPTLKEIFEMISDRLDRIDAKIEDIEERVDDIEIDIDDLEDKIDDLEEEK